MQVEKNYVELKCKKMTHFFNAEGGNSWIDQFDRIVGIFERGVDNIIKIKGGGEQEAPSPTPSIPDENPYKKTNTTGLIIAGIAATMAVGGIYFYYKNKK